MSKAWVSVVGSSLQLWTREVLKMIKAGCGGLIVVDKETALITEVLWARILVSLKGKERPSTINILENVRSYELQIWWELLSWIARVLGK